MPSPPSTTSVRSTVDRARKVVATVRRVTGAHHREQKGRDSFPPTNIDSLGTYYAPDLEKWGYK